RVVAIDMAQQMLYLGRRNVERAGLAKRIELRLVDAKQMPFGHASFDCIMSNSIVHHIPAPLAVFAEMARAVQSGGVLFVRDLLRPADLDALRHFVTTYAGDA